MKDLERSRKKCTAEIVVGYDHDGNPVVRPCGAALWQYFGKRAVCLSLWAGGHDHHREGRPVQRQSTQPRQEHDHTPSRTAGHSRRSWRIGQQWSLFLDG
jgi:hypothetical protein